MDFKLLPRTAIVGRVTNPPKLHRSRRGTKYMQLLIYLYHAGHARLLPVIAFNKEAQRIVNSHVQQGDLLNVQARIDGISNHSYINPTLICSSVSFLEPKRMREIYHGKKGKELTILFPVVPSNYHRYRSYSANHKHKTSSIANNKSLASSASNIKSKSSSSISVQIINPSIKRNKKINHKQKTDSDDYVAEANKLGKFHFPNMH